ncbi:hypothetical protein RHSIM_Rhsim13G0023400 [Rhododendron simsii]|uniref:adenylate dimethylallyltransferase (ADP/ATP-dependent) n=1 Tax=Rhododendron simsii TaxID=118357 RepID=A0A834L6K6_RHOSS|nr:hypothetical protein RHSIM_Rhsim13G0023400 [Rhododendron simsii]
MNTVMCKHTHLMTPGGALNLQLLRLPPQTEKVVVVMGATGAGKSKLSIDLATAFGGEIVNSDKIQVYKGLDIVTNKITEAEQRGVPHHLLGTVDPNSNFTAANFTKAASLAIKSISNRGRLPIIAGGSNSYIEALVESENYECCFLWVDVSIPVLSSLVSDRVDRMMEAGMVDEVRKTFNPSSDYSRGIMTAIGVPEFDRYFRKEALLNEQARANLLGEVVDEVKRNNRKLARRQLEKISRLRKVKGWKLHRLDATHVFRKQGREAEEVWERMVAGPSFEIVSRFLRNVGPEGYGNNTAPVKRAVTAMCMQVMVIAAVRHWLLYSGSWV